MKKNNVNGNPVAIVTGGARRIGAVIVKKLHQSGYDIVLHYRHSQAEAENISATLNSIRSGSCHTICTDLNNFEKLNTLIQEASLWSKGRMKILVNNASSYYETPINAVTENDWNDLINSNLKAPYFLSKYFAQYLEESEGCIVNIADIYCNFPRQDYSVYCIAKSGLIMLTKSLAVELGPSIRINSIAPSTTIWPEGSNVFTEEKKKYTIDRSPLKRKPEPEEIADAVLFLINQPSLTGQMINIDAGRSLVFS